MGKHDDKQQYLGSNIFKTPIDVSIQLSNFIIKFGGLEILSHSVAQPRLLSDAVFLRDQKSVSAASLMSAEARGRNVPCEFSSNRAATT